MIYRTTFARCLLGLLVISLLACAPETFAQRRKSKKKDELEIPEPRLLKLTTKDGVDLRCTYYAGGYFNKMVDKEVVVEKKKGKDVVPVILVHDWDGQRTQYDALATGLQQMGHAVIVPDLRGHGDSLTIEKDGEEDEIDRERMKRDAIQAIGYDIEAAKKHFLELNNEGEVNIELLCVVGSGFGATMALNWAHYDWSRKELPAFKQGRDVKGLVLLSPKQSFKGVSLNRNLWEHDAIKKKISLLILVGARDRKALRDAEAVHNRVKRHRLDQPENEPDRDLFYIELDTELQSIDLLQAPALRQPYRAIGLFVTWRHTQQAEEHPWTDRTNPLGNK